MKPPWVVFICALIDVLLIGLGIGGMGALIALAPVLLGVIRWAGAVFLFLYGLRAFHAAWKGPGHLSAESGESQTALSAVTTVLALSLLNPHVYLDTVVLLGCILSAVATSFPVRSLTFLYRIRSEVPDSNWLKWMVLSCVAG